MSVLIIKKPKALVNQGSRRFILVFASGFEPLAYRLGGGRSILLSYANILNCNASDYITNPGYDKDMSQTT